MQKSTQIRHRSISNSGKNSLSNSEVSPPKKSFESKLFAINSEELKSQPNSIKKYIKIDITNTKKLCEKLTKLIKTSAQRKNMNLNDVILLLKKTENHISNIKTKLVENDPLEMTVLRFTVEYGHDDVLELLVNLHIKLDINLNKIKGNYGKTPMHWAVKNGNEFAVKLFLTHKMDVDSEDDAQRTPLFLAASGGHNNILIQLLKNGADINKTGIYKRTPLFAAVKLGKLKTAELLIQNGANMELKDVKGNSALDLAIYLDRSEEFIKLLTPFASVANLV